MIKRNPPKPPPADAYTISEFCQLHAISEAFYYKLQKAGDGPAIMHIGRATRISKEAAEAWRRSRERKAG